ncbi:hypothetical protein F4680DRAFT_109985 [Xylaria scruposa]|nr:hypothetical protein F4680DRAFT_109985 [Xylaria scruposa]
MADNTPSGTGLEEPADGKGDPDQSSHTAAEGDRKCCFICIEEDRPLTTMDPCGHIMCLECLARWFELAISSNRIPPRCCEIIPIEQYESMLDPELVRRYREKRAELDDPNPLYCHQPRCSTHIPRTKVINGVGNCTKCGGNTCEKCKGAAHHGSCSEDKDLEKTLKLARRKNWAQCRACDRIIEKSGGCNHIV